MRLLTRASLAVFALLLALAAPQPADAYCLDADGFEHCTLGTAILAPAEQGVKVSNFGLTGQDGVSVDVTQGGPGAIAVSTNVSFDPDLGDDTYLQTSLQGPVGTENGTIVTATLRSVGGNVYLSNDTPFEGSNDQIVVLLDEHDQVVALYEGLPDGTQVLVEPADTGGDLQVQRRVPETSALTAPAIARSWLTNVGVSAVCPLGNFASGIFWDITWWDIIIFRFEVRIRIDLFNFRSSESAEGYSVALARKGPAIARGPFQQQTFTGAGLGAITVSGIETLEP